MRTTRCGTHLSPWARGCSRSGRWTEPIALSRTLARGQRLESERAASTQSMVGPNASYCKLGRSSVWSRLLVAFPSGSDGPRGGLQVTVADLGERLLECPRHIGQQAGLGFVDHRPLGGGRRRCARRVGRPRCRRLRPGSRRRWWPSRVRRLRPGGRPEDRGAGAEPLACLDGMSSVGGVVSSVVSVAGWSATSGDGEVVSSVAPSGTLPAVQLRSHRPRPRRRRLRRPNPTASGGPGRWTRRRWG